MLSLTRFQPDYIQKSKNSSHSRDEKRKYSKRAFTSGFVVAVMLAVPADGGGGGGGADRLLL